MGVKLVSESAPAPAWTNRRLPLRHNLETLCPLLPVSHLHPTRRPKTPFLPTPHHDTRQQPTLPRRNHLPHHRHPWQKDPYQAPSPE